MTHAVGEGQTTGGRGQRGCQSQRLTVGLVMRVCMPACMRVRVCVASWPLVDFAFHFSFSFRLACAYAASKEAAAAVVTVHVMSINLPEIADRPASQPVNLHNTIIVQRNVQLWVNIPCNRADCWVSFVAGCLMTYVDKLTLLFIFSQSGHTLANIIVYQTILLNLFVFFRRIL